MKIEDLIRHLAEAERDAAALLAADSFGLARVRRRDAAWLISMIEERQPHAQAA